MAHTEVSNQAAATPAVHTPHKKNKLTYQRDKEREMVRGIFRYFAVPGGVLKFPFRKYKGDKIERYELRDGEVYTLPLGVAIHLNENCKYPEYEYIPGMNVQSGLGIDRTSPAMRIQKWVHRTAFQSLDFTNEEVLNKPLKEIVTVESV